MRTRSVVSAHARKRWVELNESMGERDRHIRSDVTKRLDAQSRHFSIERRSATATFVAVVDPKTRVSFLFARCRYLSIFRILILSS